MGVKMNIKKNKMNTQSTIFHPYKNPTSVDEKQFKTYPKKNLTFGSIAATLPKDIGEVEMN